MEIEIRDAGRFTIGLIGEPIERLRAERKRKSH
jgi:uncharacterized small protein (DUF1192 family)